MTDEVKTHLFEAFFTTKPKGKGTSGQFVTCQTVVQNSKGHITVCSEVGKGTTFQIYFPLVEEAMSLATTSSQSEPLLRGTETLLVVEDDPGLRHLAADVREGVVATLSCAPPTDRMDCTPRVNTKDHRSAW